MKQIVTLGWDIGSWNSALSYKFNRGYKDSNANIPAPYNQNSVGDYHIFDVSVAYTGIKRMTVRAGVLNLLDTDPPFTNQTARFQARAYDDRFHNPPGRTFTLGARYEF